MNVGPLKPGAVPPQPQSQQGLERANEAAPTRPSPADTRRTDPDASGTRDQVDLSRAVHELQPLSTGVAASARLESGRMREVLDRVASGWYDRADVRDVVIGRLSGDLGAAHEA